MKSLYDYILESKTSIQDQIDKTLNKNSASSICTLIKKFRANKHDFKEKSNYVVFLHDDKKSNPTIEMYDLKEKYRYSITTGPLYVEENPDMTDSKAEELVNNKSINSSTIKYSYIQNEYGDKIVEVFKNKNIKVNK